MLNLIGTVGDDVEVTFVHGPNGLIGQERIDSKLVLPMGGQGFLRAGDRCRVKVMFERRDGRAFYVLVQAVLERGDGRSSTLEKVVQAIGWRSGSSTADVEGTIRGLQISRAHFGANYLGELECLINVLELAATDTKKCSGLDYTAVIAAAERLAVICFSEDLTRETATYLLIVRHCMHRKDQKRALSRLLCKTVELCKESDLAVQEHTLQAVAQYHRTHGAHLS